jgi:hypothetical protein
MWIPLTLQKTHFRVFCLSLSGFNLTNLGLVVVSAEAEGGSGSDSDIIAYKLYTVVDDDSFVNS